jgi:hypothetical protein
MHAGDWIRESPGAKTTCRFALYQPRSCPVWPGDGGLRYGALPDGTFAIRPRAKSPMIAPVRETGPASLEARPILKAAVFE